MKSENLGRTAAITTAAVLALFSSANDHGGTARFGCGTQRRLEGEGSFFIDGILPRQINSKYLPPTNSAHAGKSMTNQMYVQFQKPLLKNGKFPLVIVHVLSSKS